MIIDKILIVHIADERQTAKRKTAEAGNKESYDKKIQKKYGMDL